MKVNIIKRSGVKFGVLTILLFSLGLIISSSMSSASGTIAQIASSQVSSTVLSNNSGSLTFSIILTQGSPTLGAFSFTDIANGTFTSAGDYLKVMIAGCGNMKGFEHNEESCEDNDKNKEHQVIVTGTVSANFTANGSDIKPKDAIVKVVASINEVSLTGSVTIWTTLSPISQDKGNGCIRELFDKNRQDDRYLSSNGYKEGNSTLCDGKVTISIFKAMRPPSERLIGQASVTLNAIVKAVNDNDISQLYPLISPSWKQVYRNPSGLSSSFGSNQGVKIISASITGRPIVKSIDGINYAGVPCKITVKDRSGAIMKQSWMIEFEYEEGQWWFFGTG